jgi:hypothetical protein
LPGFVLPDASDPLAPVEAPARLKTMQGELAELEKNPVELPTAMGVAEGKVTDLKIHLRGSHLTLGDRHPGGSPLSLRTRVPRRSGRSRAAGSSWPAGWPTRRTR